MSQTGLGVCAADKNRFLRRRAITTARGIGERARSRRALQQGQQLEGREPPSEGTSVRCHANWSRVDIRRKFRAAQRSFHSEVTLLRPRKLNCLNPRTFLIQPWGASEIHLRLR